MAGEMVDDGCRVCGSARLSAVAELQAIPVYCNTPCVSRSDALAVPRADMHLAFCNSCGHLFNQSFDASLIAYDTGYESALDHSPRFREYAQALVADLVERCNLRGKSLVEIGCGQGAFLKALCAAGSNQGTGFDPSYRGASSSGSARFVRDVFDVSTCTAAVDFLCCRHALEHFADPVGFLRDLRGTLGEQRTTVFFEVPNGLYTLRDLGVWDLIYEHVSYFCESSLARAFEQSGFEVLAVNEAFDGQFLTILARPTADPAGPVPVMNGLACHVDAFRSRFAGRRSEWEARLERYRDCGADVVVWGGGSKGVTFLNLVDATSTVSRVVDLNPAKHGRFVPGTGQPFVAPVDLERAPGDAVIVMNPIYADEITAMLADMGQRSEVVIA
jgi:hypothetical protein